MPLEGEGHGEAREEEEDQSEKDGKNVSRRTKRINFKVDSLERQRAKLLEKQKQNETH